MAQTWEQALVNAGTENARAHFEMNKPGLIPPQKSDLSYVLGCVMREIEDLRECRTLLKRRIRGGSHAR